MDMSVGARKNYRAKIPGDRVARPKPPAPPSSLGTVRRPYERFLELPVAFVLAVLWMVAAALLVSGALALLVAVRGLLTLAA